MTEVTVLKIFNPDTVWPFSPPKIFSEIELSSRSVPVTIKLLLVSSSIDFIITLVPWNVLEALSPFNEKFDPAFTFCDFAIASSSNEDISSKTAIILFSSNPLTTNSPDLIWSS